MMIKPAAGSDVTVWKGQGVAWMTGAMKESWTWSWKWWLTLVVLVLAVVGAVNVLKAVKAVGACCSGGVLRRLGRWCRPVNSWTDLDDEEQGNLNFPREFWITQHGWDVSLTGHLKDDCNYLKRARTDKMKTFGWCSQCLR